jgi:hypothetical protein
VAVPLPVNLVHVHILVFGIFADERSIPRFHARSGMALG